MVRRWASIATSLEEAPRGRVTGSSHQAEDRPVSVRVDEHGLDQSALAATDARGVLVTPAHQSPTGVVLAPARRQALAEWAEARDAIIVEDDYDSEFRYDREPVGALRCAACTRAVVRR